MSGKKTPPTPHRSAIGVKVGDKVSIKSHLREKKGEVYEVVEIVTVSIMNNKKRVQNIHVSNLDVV